ncbi:hypothetical protein V5O48_017822 [Marasmius crinis-equi]|uniref:BZIP domain-containing protein n=1 Tax=Marasmius crinis-equi TaxID=585013 RepID=A0ABR3EMX9_9AGAR
MRKISSNSKQEMPSTSSPQYRGILNVPRPGLDFQAQTHPHAVNANSSSRYASGTPNRRGRARRQRLARILDAKDKKLTILKAELTKISNDNQRVRAETCRAQAEIERLSRSNVELKEAIRAKDYLHATAMAQERERASIERDQLSLKLDARESKHHSTDEHALSQSGNDYHPELDSLKTELAAVKARFESTVAEWIEHDLQRNSLLDSKDIHIAHLEMQLFMLTQQRASLSNPDLVSV